MKVITISRKPCRGGTTHNVVEYEAGALNIDGSRLRPGKGGSRDGEKSRARRYTERGSTNFAATPGPRGGDKRGRWPANAILMHQPGCRLRGTRTIEGYRINRWVDGAKPFGGGAGHDFETEVLPDEELLVWECAEECPHMVLDPLEGRYFKQVQRANMNEIPEELWDYLYTLIAPPPDCKPLLIVEEGLENVDFSKYDDSTVHGVVTVGDPGPFMEELDRVLRPGAHVLLIAPENEPTGYQGACSVEDFGYEIRDAVALLDQPDDFYYVAKPSGKERHAGVEQHEDEATGRFVQNSHETVKPVGVMQALLHDIPTNQGPVVDPFLGSGTTGIAALHTKHDFVGIEQSEDYLKIADQRVRHWDRAVCAWDGVEIVSDVKTEEEDEGPIGVEDLFGL